MNFCNIKRFLAYSIYLAIVAYIMVASNKYLKYFCYKHDMYFSPFYFLLLSVFPVFIGLLLALPQFISTLKKPGSLQFDWIFFFAAGLPAFCITITPFISQTQLAAFWPLTGLITYHDLLTLGGIIFGYISLTAFYKIIKYDFPEYLWNDVQ